MLVFIGSFCCFNSILSMIIILNTSVQPPKSWMLGGWWWANPLQTFPQGPLLTFHVDPDPELDNFLVQFLSIYDDLMSHHVP